MRGYTGHYTQPHDRLQPRFLGKTMQLNVALIRKLRDVLQVIFLHAFNEYLYKHALTDVRSTSAELKCLY